MHSLVTRHPAQLIVPPKIKRRPALWSQKRKLCCFIEYDIVTRNLVANNFVRRKSDTERCFELAAQGDGDWLTLSFISLLLPYASPIIPLPGQREQATIRRARDTCTSHAERIERPALNVY